ncbi:tripartite tricarboxylate transporter substrate binding protein [Bordetella sp. BOR01]|uniref:Bug family tripartite tricarboxylate transporter substrate binding protein n=1 Tax=Bordetella sp. BOR01 TaxID=2854779 RepID=UPI001C43C308|nr:tripartite tricarboxylate transporter substrate binding protein [Bordetella sp. BOR01]MBV7484042.1 tripartite tricarboxylate transporter substrate binding protein [Bordetella sp. BOR01]
MFLHRWLSCAALALLVSTSAWAAAPYPAQPVRVIVPFAPGGNIDVATRLLASKLAERLGQPFIVENRPGAGGAIGAEAVARAQPDGYTLLSGSNGLLAVNPAVNPSLSYDPLTSFAPVAFLSRVPLALVVSAKLPVHDLEELKAYAAKSGKGISIGSSGAGGAQHLAIVEFASKADIPFVHVPYRGGSAILPDLIAGNVDAALNELPNVLPNHRDGKLRIIAIASDQRSALLPDVPTLREAGLADFTAYSSNGWLAPAGTPAAVIQQLNQALVQALADTAVHARLEEMGLVVTPPADAGAQAYRTLMERDLANAREIAAKHQIRAN